MVFFFANRFPTDQAIIRSFSFLIPQMGLVYLNMELLIPRLFIKKRYVEYIFWILALFIITSVLLYVINEQLFFDEGGPRGQFRLRPDRPPRFNPIRGMVFTNAMLTMAVVFLSSAYKTTQIALSKEKEAANLKSENLNSELKFLKSQINPHFLFNSLHNIYALSLLNSEKTPGMIVKLSDMLRYIIYDCNEEKVALKKEIDYIDNFISFQKLKDDEIKNIEVAVDVENENAMIEPMLFIPFIENSFKHSKIEDVESGWIKISLKTSRSEIYFEAINSLPEKTFTKDKVGGIGIDNVKRRLELLYPDRHDLDIVKSKSEFKVALKLLL